MDALTAPLILATASSHKAPVKRRRVSWETLIQKLKAVKVGPKEIDVFVPADMPDGRRRQSAVISITALCFDIDNKGVDKPIYPKTLNEIIMRQGLSSIIYTTHSHRTDYPRCRLIIQLNEPLDVMPYKRVAHKVAKKLGIERYMDKSCVEPARCYFMPACDSQYVDQYQCRVSYGEPLKVDEFLAGEQGRPFELNTCPVESPLVIEQAQDGRKETPEAVAEVKAVLDAIPPDLDYERWRNVCWAVCSLGWSSGHELLLEWSKRSAVHWRDELKAQKAEAELKKLVGEYDDSWGIGFDRAVHYARENGYEEPSPFDVVDGFVFQDHREAPTEAPTEVAVEAEERYVLQNRQHLMALPSLRWLVKGVLPDRGLAAAYGPSGSGKTFFILDLAAAICLGDRWFGCRTKETPVVYLGLEGGAGLQNRVKAWEAARNRQYPDNFSFLLEDFDLTRQLDVEGIIKAAGTGSVVIIDTLNRAAPHLDENSSGDMGKILRAAKRIEQGIGGLVLLVHHTGKDSSKGLRGHSSLHAALDAEIVIKRNPKTGERSWQTAKLKDGREDSAHGFRLVQHILGKDDDGDTETSCSVERDILIAAKPEPTGSQQKPAYAVLKSLIGDSQVRGKGGALFHQGCIDMDAAVSAVVSVLAAVPSNKRRNRARQIITDLCSKGFVATGIDEADEAWVWLSDE